MRSPKTWIVLAAALLGLLAVLGGWLATVDPGSLRRQLGMLTPLGAQFSALLLVGAAWASRKAIGESLLGSRAIPAVLGVSAMVLVWGLPPRTHRIYYDEDIYQNIAQNILWRGRAEMCNEGVIEAGTYHCLAVEYNKEPNGFPFMLSLAFRLSGVQEASAHVLNNLLFALGVVCAYWLGCLFFRDVQAAVGASLLYLLTPENLLWGATVAVEPGAAAFAAVAVGAACLWRRSPSWGTGLFAVAALAFAVQWRPESVLLVPLVAAVALASGAKLSRVELLSASVLLLALLAPHTGHLSAVSGEPWGSVEGRKFSLDYVPGNLKTNLWYYLEGREYPLYFTLLGLVGLVWRGRSREKALLMLWFVLLFGVFIPFHAGSYRYGADIRFSLLSAMPLALLGGFGASSIGNWLSSRRRRPLATAVPHLATLYFFSAFLPFVRAVGSEAWAARADHEVAEEMLASVPGDSIVLTHNPGMLQVMGQSAAQTSIATYQPALVDNYFRRFSGGVYFHFSFWCNVPDPVQNRFCTQVLKTYPTRVLVERSAGFNRYVLYRVLPPEQTQPALDK